MNSTTIASIIHGGFIVNTVFVNIFQKNINFLLSKYKLYQTNPIIPKRLLLNYFNTAKLLYYDRKNYSFDINELSGICVNAPAKTLLCSAPFGYIRAQKNPRLPTERRSGNDTYFAQINYFALTALIMPSTRNATQITAATVNSTILTVLFFASNALPVITVGTTDTGARTVSMTE